MRPCSLFSLDHPLVLISWPSALCCQHGFTISVTAPTSVLVNSVIIEGTHRSCMLVDAQINKNQC